MNTEAEPTQTLPGRRPLHLRRGVWLTLSSLALLFAATLILMPHGIDYGLERLLRSQGVDSASIENVDFNPFAARLSLYDLQVRRGEAEPLLIRQLDLHLKWLPLWQRKIVVNGLTIKGIALEMESDRDGIPIHVGGMELSTSHDGGEGAPWLLHVERFELQDSVVRYRDPLLTGELQIRELNLEGFSTSEPERPAGIRFQGQLNGSPIALDGKLTPFAADPGFTGRLRLEGLSLKPFAGRLGPLLSMLEGHLTVTSDLRLARIQGKALEIAQKGEIQADGLVLETAEARLGSDSLDWKGSLNFRLAGDHSSLDLLGSAGWKGLTATLGGADTADISQASFAWSGELNLTDDSSARSLSAKGSVETGKTGVKIGRHLVSFENLEIPELTLETPRWDDSGLQLVQQAEIRLAGLALREESPRGQESTMNAPTDEAAGEGSHKPAPEPAGGIGVETLRWNGRSRVALGETVELQELRGDLELQDLTARDPEADYTLFSLQQLQVVNLGIDGPGRLGIDRVEADGLLVGGDNAEPQTPPMLRGSHLRLADIGYSEDEGMRIAEIEPDGVEQQVLRDTDGSWNHERLIAAIERLAGATTAEAEPEPDRAGSTPLPLAIERIRVTGDSLIRFRDATTQPAFSTEIRLDQLQIEGLANSPADHRSPFVVDARMGQSARLNASGSVAPFAERLTLDLKGRIEGLELPPLTAYAAPLIGYNLDSGELSADIALKADQGVIEGENQLVMHQFTASALDPESAKALEAKISVPLDTALGMLRDKNNTIRINLPVSGDIDDLKVDPSDAINQALGSAMKKGAKTYLATALFPFGTLVTLVQIAGEEAMKVKLDPVEFIAATVTLDDQDREYLGKVATVMQDRPEINIRLCGIATESDREVLYQAELEKAPAGEKAAEGKTDSPEKPQEPPPPPSPVTDQRLLELALQRANAIEEHLVQEHGIAAERLVACRPQIEAAAQKEEGSEKDGTAVKPRVDLLI